MQLTRGEPDVLSREVRQVDTLPGCGDGWCFIDCSLD